MRTIEKSLSMQKNAQRFWLIMTVVSLLMLFSPAAADKLISFEASMAAAFIGLIMLIVSISMAVIYGKRKKLVASLSDNQSLFDVWECDDRYGANKGAPIQAFFSAKGLFYSGNPYPLKSYECVITGAELVNDEGPALSILYTVPNSRAGAIRHKNVLNIPVPQGKEASAQNIARFYSSVK